MNLARDLQTALVATLRYGPVLATESEGRLAAIVDFTARSTFVRGIFRPQRCDSVSISEIEQ